MAELIRSVRKSRGLSIIMIEHVMPAVMALSDRVITVHAIAAGDDPAMQWRISIEGAPCRLTLLLPSAGPACERARSCSV